MNDRHIVNGVNIRVDVSVVNMPATPRDSYHHGDLRAALLAAGRELLAERGAAGFSLSELARRVGVSTAAPYRHFADRVAILDALADEGYGIFGEGLRAAIAVDDGSRAWLHRIGVAYLGFARDHPELFEIMFADREGRPALAGPPTFEPLVTAVAAAQREGVLPDDRTVASLARTIWATLHGLAVLEARGGLSKLGLGGTHETLVGEALAVMLRPA